MTKLDNELIEKEKDRFGYHMELKPISFSPFKILNHYHIFEFTTQWYDSDAPECRTCNRECLISEYCEAWENWRSSEKRLSFNNWVDVIGQGVWGMSQKECDEKVREIFEREIYKDGSWRERLFYWQPEDPDQINLFYYNRDRGHYDYWFIFVKEAQPWSF
jgi:hypothetical protein